MALDSHGNNTTELKVLEHKTKSQSDRILCWLMADRNESTPADYLRRFTKRSTSVVIYGKSTTINSARDIKTSGRTLAYKIVSNKTNIRDVLCSYYGEIYSRSVVCSQIKINLQRNLRIGGTDTKRNGIIYVLFI